MEALRNHVQESSLLHFFVSEVLGRKHKWFVTENAKTKEKDVWSSILLTTYSAAFKKNELELCVLIRKNSSENIKLWNNMCDTVPHLKFKTDRIVYTYAEMKGQGECITKWLVLGWKWNMGFRARRGILKKGNFICILYFYVSCILTKIVF